MDSSDGGMNETKMADLSIHKIKKQSKKIIKPAREELERVRESAKQQVSGKYDQDGGSQQSSIVEAMQQKSGNDLTPQEEENRKVDMKKRAKKLEEEIEQERRKRKQKEEEWAKSQEPEEMISQPGKPLEMPASKPSRGVMSGRPGGPKTPKSPETRKSRH